ncbi:hypothetical protein L873DRAFT_1814083 [Choiromyces venosus 120613-1]|uniref:Uncharacterized protein n=1 Tax=Choiromyces venosus 120613-1 TaxID=1336337 RepID=A0A3N4J8P0_9PEZI|nr:hypothetical protein L873DRAFT_1814083 [Choiromyces venosus 120613-1]
MKKVIRPDGLPDHQITLFDKSTNCIIPNRHQLLPVYRFHKMSRIVTTAPGGGGRFKAACLESQKRQVLAYRTSGTQEVRAQAILHQKWPISHTYSGTNT